MKPFKVISATAGALLGLGLRGYLGSDQIDTFVSFMNGPFNSICLVAMAIFIGSCANAQFAGSKNLRLTRLLSVHLHFLMPLQEQGSALLAWLFEPA